MIEAGLISLAARTVAICKWRSDFTEGTMTIWSGRSRLMIRRCIPKPWAALDKFPMKLQPADFTTSER